ncbi:MAG: hypothetical protein AAF206_13115 [Bacteroidota bacterium]
MKTFVHFMQQQLEEKRQRLIELREIYLKRGYAFPASFTAFMEDCQTCLKELGKTEAESVLSRNRVFFDNCLKGIHPIRMEKVSTHKRAMMWALAPEPMQQIENILLNELEKVNEKLKSANVDVQNVLLMALQTGVLKRQALDQITNLDAVDALWAKLCQDDNVNLLHQKLLLSIYRQDILILMDQNIQRIQTR